MTQIDRASRIVGNLPEHVPYDGVEGAIEILVNAVHGYQRVENDHVDLEVADHFGNFFAQAAVDLHITTAVCHLDRRIESISNQEILSQVDLEIFADRRHPAQ